MSAVETAFSIIIFADSWVNHSGLVLSLYQKRPGNFLAIANYLLLTEIIETLTDQPFYVAMRTLLKYDELQLNHTWFPTLEDQPAGSKALVHQYWESYNWDSYELDVSWDLYGGGGIACPTKDLARFVQSYFTGKIVVEDSIRNLIFTEIPAKEIAGEQRIGKEN